MNSNFDNEKNSCDIFNINFILKENKNLFFILYHYLPFDFKANAGIALLVFVGIYGLQR